MTKLNLEELEALCKHENESGDDVLGAQLIMAVPQLIARIREQDKTIAALRKALGEKDVKTLYEGKDGL